MKATDKKTYVPSPADTSEVKLSKDVLELCELIAENTHDVWAVGRINEGWSYGECRNDELKHHPCLVPYGELSESEKEYDRSTAMEALKLITKLGYTITKNEPDKN